MLPEIDAFWRKIRVLEFAWPQARGAADFDPSNIANIWKGIFPIHPIASTSLPRIDNFVDRFTVCTICQDEFLTESKRVVAEL